MNGLLRMIFCGKSMAFDPRSILGHLLPIDRVSQRISTDTIFQIDSAASTFFSIEIILLNQDNGIESQ
jgi:nicotinic acid mononucleotide adenylyltransferase